jgi:hypothetical protein
MIFFVRASPQKDPGNLAAVDAVKKAVLLLLIQYFAVYRVASPARKAGGKAVISKMNSPGKRPCRYL